MIVITENDVLRVWKGDDEAKYINWKMWSADYDEPNERRPPRPDPTLVFDREEQNELVRHILTGPMGPVGMMGPAGISG